MHIIRLLTRVTLVALTVYIALGMGLSVERASAGSSIIAQINHAKAGQTISAPAGTFVGDVTIPSGVTVRGAGMNTSWIKGNVVYGSNCVIRDVKLGKAYCSTRNGPGASRTLFKRVRFVGGGQAAGSWPHNAVLIIGSRYSCDHITFRSCVVTRNAGSDPDFSKGFNNISLIERAGVHVESILFEECTVAGAPRMGIEGYVSSGRGVSQGFRDITLRGCMFKASDAHTLDFSDQPDARANGILIEGCTIQGGGVTRVRWGYGVCLEMPLNVVIRNNRFTRAWTQSLNITERDNSGYSGPAARITGNTFDLTTGVASGGGEPICLKGADNVFTGNTIRGGWGGNVVGLWEATGNTVVRNTFNMSRGAEAVRVHSGSGNTIAPNTVQ